MTSSINNPYQNALDGLKIDDPVRAFFEWCIERERIRLRREAGEPPPWSSDPVFQKGRFLNVFREDDKGTKAVLRFAGAARGSLPGLVHALFFARWCNQHTTLNALTPAVLGENAPSLRRILLEAVPQPWNSPVYPVVPVMWQGQVYERLAACVDLFPRCLGFLEDCLRAAQGSVVLATRCINARFQMSNDFPIFMALADLAWFEPDLIHPDSPVPTGIGAVPYLDRLQKHLGCADHQETARRMIALQPVYWPDAPRRFNPIDIEYISCECRKYYSYINGTKTFEGRNLFVPAAEDRRRL